MAIEIYYSYLYQYAEAYDKLNSLLKENMLEDGDKIYFNNRTSNRIYECSMLKRGKTIDFLFDPILLYLGMGEANFAFERNVLGAGSLYSSIDIDLTGAILTVKEVKYVIGANTRKHGFTGHCLYPILDPKHKSYDYYVSSISIESLSFDWEKLPNELTPDTYLFWTNPGQLRYLSDKNENCLFQGMLKYIENKKNSLSKENIDNLVLKLNECCSNHENFDKIKQGWLWNRDHNNTADEEPDHRYRIIESDRFTIKKEKIQEYIKNYTPTLKFYETIENLIESLRKTLESRLYYVENGALYIKMFHYRQMNELNILSNKIAEMKRRDENTLTIEKEKIIGEKREQELKPINDILQKYMK